MNIKILDSWLREFVKTRATAQQIAEKLSLCAVSVERLEKVGADYSYDIEVTTNRPDLMSVVGLARETTAVLSHSGINATFVPPRLSVPRPPASPVALTIKNNDKLVNRLLAVVMEVKLDKSPRNIQERLEATDIRSLNNLIDITNYVMRTIGHPTHVFDYDRLMGHSIAVRESKAGEKIQTLDGKEYTLLGGDIVAEDGSGTVIDLLGVMGLYNSVVTDDTKRIVFFVNNDEPNHVRKTSMTHGIRTEAAVLNEKGVDPQLALDAMLYGIALYQQLADAKLLTPITDIYPNKLTQHTITVTKQQIDQTIGIEIPLRTSTLILTHLGFKVETLTDRLTVTPPTFRASDMEIPEDIVEEIARIYGYHNIPNRLPAITSAKPAAIEKNEFYWENRIKDAMKYWGFTEVYTYSMVPENLYEGPLNDAVTIQNPLSEEFMYMRRTLVPSLLRVIRENKDHESIKIFEIAQVYEKNGKDLPIQTVKIAGVIKAPKVNFYEAKGIIEQLAHDLEIKDLNFKQLETGGYGSTIYVGREKLGDIEVLDNETLDFEISFNTLLSHATLKKVYKPVSKFPPIVEDMAIIAPLETPTGDLMNAIKSQSSLIEEVTLLDKYKDTRTFHIIYQSYQKNLTSADVEPIRIKIQNFLRDKFDAKLKE